MQVKEGIEDSTSNVSPGERSHQSIKESKISTGKEMGEVKEV